MSQRKWLLMVVTVLLLIVVGWSRHMSDDIDQCLDDSGAWDYKTHTCQK